MKKFFLFGFGAVATVVLIILLIVGLCLGSLYFAYQYYILPKAICTSEVSGFKVELIKQNVNLGNSDIFYQFYKDGELLNVPHRQAPLGTIEYTGDISFGIKHGSSLAIDFPNLSKSQADTLCGLTSTETEFGVLLGDTYLYKQEQNKFYYVGYDKDSLKFGNLYKVQILNAFREILDDRTSTMDIKTQELKRTKDALVITNRIEVKPTDPKKKSKNYVVVTEFKYERANYDDLTILDHHLSD
jgi:hypothetical protein